MFSSLFYLFYCLVSKLAVIIDNQEAILFSKKTATSNQPVGPSRPPIELPCSSTGGSLRLWREQVRRKARLLDAQQLAGGNSIDYDNLPGLGCLGWPLLLRQEARVVANLWQLVGSANMIYLYWSDMLIATE